MLFPKISVTSTQALYRRLVLQGGGPPTRSTAASFLDIMAQGTLQQKRVVIAMIADAFDPAFASALRSALNDAEPAIRVQAATAAASIESTFLNRAIELQARSHAHPQDRDVILALARHHEEYAASGLLDDARAQAELTEAIACCERASAIYIGDPLVAETMARLFVLQGCIKKARQQLQPLLASPAPTPGALANYCTCLFQRGQFGNLRDACQQFGAATNLADVPAGLDQAQRLCSGDATTQVASRILATGGYHEAA